MLVKMIYWVKNSETEFGIFCRQLIRLIINPQFPVIPGVHTVLYQMHKWILHILSEFLRIVYFTPLFKSQIKGAKKQLYLYSGLPLVLGNIEIQMGNKVRLSGITTLCGRNSTNIQPKLIIGNNVDIGWQNSISVGTKVIIENDVRLAGKVFLAGYPGHPIDSIDRAAGKPDLAEQIGDIIIKQGAWLGTGVTVLAGVTIGEGAIIGAASVVTKDIPANCIAAGNPARVVRKI